MSVSLVRGLAVGALSSLTREGLSALLHKANPNIVDFIAHGGAVVLQGVLLNSSLSEAVGNVLGSYAGTLLAVCVANQIFHLIDSGESGYIHEEIKGTNVYLKSTPESRWDHLVYRMYVANGTLGLMEACSMSAYKVSKGNIIAAITGGLAGYCGAFLGLASKKES